MNPNRNAYTLLEVLAIIAAIVVLMALSVKPMRTLVSDIPRANRDFQTWIKTQDMLAQLKNDVEQSIQIKTVDIDPRISGPLLYLQQPEQLVIYSLTAGDVIRQTDTSESNWDLPHVNIDWHLWENKGAPYALEITTWTERIILNKNRKRFEQSSVYFRKTGSLNYEK
jgi:hypothetical protein